MADSIDQIKKKHALSGWPMILAWVAMMIFAFHASTHMVGAGDTWVAMACGRHFINHGVDTIEPFSANSHKAGPTEETMAQYAKELRAGLYSVKDPPSGMKRSVISWWLKKVENYPNWSDGTKKLVKYWHPTGWVNQNWLTHVIFYWVTHLSPVADAEEYSYNSLVYWKIALYILNIICVYYIGRVLGVNPALSAVFACFAMFVGRSFFDVRPAGFSNLLVAVYLLILLLTTHRNILYIWLLVPLAAFWCNLHGGYIYAFIMLIPFMGLHLLMALPKKWSLILYNVAAWPLFLMVAISIGSKKPEEQTGSAYALVFLFLVGIIVLDILLVTLRDKLANIGYKGLIHTVAASFAAFVATIVLNPFHLTNLTHTFVISLSKQAERWRTVNEWHPAFEWKNPVGDEIPFLIMYIIAWILLAVWAVIYLKTRSTVDGLPKRRKKDKDKEKETYKLPKIDITFIAITALTIYMAISSRRFIPIAAMAACPLLAVFIDQVVRAISATANLRKTNSLIVPAMSREMQNYFTVAGVVAVLFFGTWWGLKFKTVYLDVWPTDPKLTSVFMRMTASDVKPFYVMRFINENKLEGKMFNYWTEGGFIAYGQDPDPNTGKTSLQLFMDGRAQAAYLQTTYDIWSDIMSGGRVAYRLRRQMRARGQKSLSASAYREIGAWIDKKLTKYDVWAVLMPAGQFRGHFLRGLEYDPNWNVIFYNNKQKLFVRISDPKALKLLNGIHTGETKYPDEFSRNLIRAHYLLMPSKDNATLQQGLQFAFDAFNNHPSNAPMQKILYATRLKNPQLTAKATQFLQDYFDRFDENEKEWKNIDGYHHKLAAALNASGYLHRLARAKKDQKKTKRYELWIKEHKGIARNIVKTKRW